MFSKPWNWDSGCFSWSNGDRGRQRWLQKLYWYMGVERSCPIWTNLELMLRSSYDRVPVWTQFSPMTSIQSSAVFISVVSFLNHVFMLSSLTFSTLHPNWLWAIASQTNTSSETSILISFRTEIDRLFLAGYLFLSPCIPAQLLEITYLLDVRSSSQASSSAVIRKRRKKFFVLIPRRGVIK